MSLILSKINEENLFVESNIKEQNNKYKGKRYGKEKKKEQGRKALVLT